MKESGNIRPQYHCHYWYYLLTYSMVQSPSWEANWFAASQEIPRILWNWKVHYRTHKRPPPVPILCQPNPVHIPTSHLLEIHPNIIHPSTPRSPQWSLSLQFPHQDPIRPPLLIDTRHMPSPSHSSRFYHPHNIGYRKSDVHVASTRWKTRTQFLLQTLKGSANRRKLQNNVTMTIKETAGWRRVLVTRWNGGLSESLGSIKGQEFNDYETPIQASEDGLCRSVMGHLLW